jgi:hypothetical protein
MPIQYRVFGGLLQSLNIQFGNFLEVLMYEIIKEEPHLQIVQELSGKKNVLLTLTAETDATIDRFITSRQVVGANQLKESFAELLDNIIGFQQVAGDEITIKHDIDVLFQNRQTKTFYYVEVKYNDDHDTGKFIDINRKFIKTYAGLVKALNITDSRQLKPILYYFSRKIMKGNIYVPEETNVYRGEKLFHEFLTVPYDSVDGYLKTVSEDEKILKIFDDLYQKIRHAG